jgi:hypothetical protein
MPAINHMSNGTENTNIVKYKGSYCWFFFTTLLYIFMKYIFVGLIFIMIRKSENRRYKKAMFIKLN